MTDYFAALLHRYAASTPDVELQAVPIYGDWQDAVTEGATDPTKDAPMGCAAPTDRPLAPATLAGHGLMTGTSRAALGNTTSVAAAAPSASKNEVAQDVKQAVKQGENMAPWGDAFVLPAPHNWPAPPADRAHVSRHGAPPQHNQAMANMSAERATRNAALIDLAPQSTHPDGDVQASRGTPAPCVLPPAHAAMTADPKFGRSGEANLRQTEPAHGAGSLAVRGYAAGGLTYSTDSIGRFPADHTVTPPASPTPHAPNSWHNSWQGGVVAPRTGGARIDAGPHLLIPPPPTKRAPHSVPAELDAERTDVSRARTASAERIYASSGSGAHEAADSTLPQAAPSIAATQQPGSEQPGSEQPGRPPGWAPNTRSAPARDEAQDAPNHDASRSRPMPTSVGVWARSENAAPRSAAHEQRVLPPPSANWSPQPDPPSVIVTIERLDVRAASAAPPGARARRPDGLARRVSLEEYAARRSVSP